MSHGERPRKTVEVAPQTLTLLQSEISGVAQTVGRRLTDVGREVERTLEAARRVFGITEQLQNLQKIFTHQKQRGNLGERSLEQILSNMLAPGTYKMQHEPVMVPSGF